MKKLLSVLLFLLFALNTWATSSIVGSQTGSSRSSSTSEVIPNPPTPTYPANQVKAVECATYNATSDFGDWYSGTSFSREAVGLKYVTTSLGYFGICFEDDKALNCAEMEALHLDIYPLENMSVGIVPIHGGPEIRVTKQLTANQWNTIDIQLSEFYNGTDWTNTIQIKLDNCANKTFYVNNVFFYTTHIPTNITVPTDITVTPANNTITYTARTKLSEFRSYAFNVSITSHTFSNGTGTITFAGEVTSIGSSAFSNCSGLTSVTIPNSVMSIGNWAFEYCSGLTSITIPNSVTSIGVRAFEGCSGLTSITIPESVTSIGDIAFSGCSGLTSITIPNSVTSIGEWAFNRVANVIYNGSATGTPWAALTINGTIDGIFTYADAEKTQLTRCATSATGAITIPNSVTSIGKYAFYGCSGLTSVTFPNSVTSIGNYAFSDCTGLTSVTFPNSVTSIGKDAFSGCSNLTSVVWNAVNCASPSSSSAAPFYSIRNNITNFTIGEGVTTIPSYLCYGMENLTSATIPNSVTSIRSSAFSGCSGLTKTNYTGTLAQWCAIEFANPSSNPASCSKNLYINDVQQTQLNIPEGVTDIGSSAFYGCSSLASVTIPNSVTSIGEYAFYGCSGLTSITAERIRPAVCASNSCFSDVDKSIPLYVPANSMTIYWTAIGWQDFTNILPIPGTEVYTITFLGANGETLQSSEVAEGDMPTYTGATPTKAEDANYTYAFSGWSPVIVAATAAAVYTAQFTATPKVTKHTLSFYTLTSRRGTLFSSAEVAVGDAIPYPADAAIAAAFGVSTDQYGIVWMNGSKQPVAADATMPDNDWSLYADTVRLAAPTHTAIFYVLTTFSGEFLSEAEVEEDQVIPFPTDAAVAAAFGISLDQYNVVWYDENDNVLSKTATMPGTNIECFADIERKPDPTYALRFFTYTTFSGELLSSTTLQAGKTIPFPTDAAVAAAFGVSLDQYDVVWYDEDDNVLTRTTKMPAHAFDCYADIEKKTVHTYTLTFMTLNTRRGTVFGSPQQLAAGAAIPWPTDAAIAAVFGVSADDYDIIWMDANKQVVARDMVMSAANLTLYADIAAKPLPGHTVSFYTYTTFSGTLLNSVLVETGEVVSFPSDNEIAAIFGYSLDRYDVVWMDADDNEVDFPVLMPDNDVAFYADMVEKTIPTPDVLSNYAISEPIYDENTYTLSSLRVGHCIAGNINVSANALRMYLNSINKAAAVYVDLTGVLATETFDIATVLPDGMNPNCLFYVNADAYITGVNVVTITDVEFDVDLYDGVSQAPNRAIYYDLTDKYPFANKYAFKAVKATYHRDFQSGTWNMITLPFEVTMKTWNRGSWWCATFNGFNSGTQEFNFIQSTTLSANVPHVLMSANQTESELEAQNTLVYITDSPLRRSSTVVGDESLLWGVYEKTCPAISSDYRYFTLNASGNMVRFSSPTSSIGSTRAYLRVPSAELLAPSRIVITDLETNETLDIIWEDTTIDADITTDFEDMSACHTTPVVHDNRIYSVDGKFIGTERDNLPTGVYTQNSEKFIVY